MSWHGLWIWACFVQGSADVPDWLEDGREELIPACAAALYGQLRPSFEAFYGRLGQKESFDGLCALLFLTQLFMPLPVRHSLASYSCPRVSPIQICKKPAAIEFACHFHA